MGVGGGRGAAERRGAGEGVVTLPNATPLDFLALELIERCILSIRGKWNIYRGSYKNLKRVAVR